MWCRWWQILQEWSIFTLTSDLGLQDPQAMVRVSWTDQGCDVSGLSKRAKRLKGQ